MKKLSYILSISFIVASTSLFAQFRSAKLIEGDQMYFNKKYFEAVNAYKVAYEENPSLHEVVDKIGRLLAQNGAHEEALIWYKKLMDYNLPKEYPKVQFSYAQSLHQLGRYNEAIKEYSAFIKTYKGDDKASLSKTIKNTIEGCENAMNAKVDKKYKVKALDKVNSLYTDINPKVIDGKLYITSIPTDTPLTYLDEEGIKQTFDFWSCNLDLDEDTILDPLVLFGPKKLKTEKSHHSSFTLSLDGQRMYLSKCKSGRDYDNHCQLYVSNLENDKWGEPVLLGPRINGENGEYSSTHPAIGWTKKRKKRKDLIYFSSTRPGGKGGYDLWSIEIGPKNKLGKPKNLGAAINTPANEITPNYSHDVKTLFYSSNGGIGFGGYDVFKVKLKGKRFKKPESMSPPFNTSADDFGLQRYDKGRYVIASNRQGAKKYYQNYLLDDIFIITDEQGRVKPKTLIVNTFQKDSALTKVDSLSLIASVNSKPLKNIVSGKYFTVYVDSSYTFGTQVDGYINSSKTLNVLKTMSDTIELTLSYEKINEEKEIRLDNIYFAYASADLTDSSKLELDKLLPLLESNPKIIIEISAHTDNKGRKAYNQALSQRRAQSAVDYLISKGIIAERLVAKGYGMSKPIAPNNKPDGSDNPEGRKLNRRIVFKVIGELEDKNLKVVPKEGTVQETSKETMENDSTSTEVMSAVSMDSTSTLVADSGIAVVKEIASIDTTSAAANPTEKLSNESSAVVDSSKKAIENTNETAVPTDEVAESTGVEEKTSEDLNNDATEEDDGGKEKFSTTPIDASPVKGRVRWLVKAGAQLIEVKDKKSSFKITAATFIAKKKNGAKFKVVITKASGKKVYESEEVEVKKLKSATQKAVEYVTVDLDFELKKGQYFIYPEVSSGKLGFLPNVNQENTFDNGKLIIAPSMFNNQSTDKTKYKFKTSEIKSGRLKNYGPGLNLQFEKVPFTK